MMTMRLVSSLVFFSGQLVHISVAETCLPNLTRNCQGPRALPCQISERRVSERAGRRRRGAMWLIDVSDLRDV